MQHRTVRDRLSPKISGDIRGMNAVELVMMLLLVGIMAGVSTPLVNNVIQRSRLDGAARRIASDLRYTQALAVSRGGEFKLNSAAGACAPQAGEIRYRIEQSPGTPFTECYLLSSEFQGVTITSIAGDGGAPTVTEVRFNSRGTCVNCTGGGVTPPVVVTISGATGTPATVRVRTTGSVSVP